jgi:hypothetical protein
MLWLRWQCIPEEMVFQIGRIQIPDSAGTGIAIGVS